MIELFKENGFFTVVALAIIGGLFTYLQIRVNNKNKKELKLIDKDIQIDSDRDKRNDSINQELQQRLREILNLQHKLEVYEKDIEDLHKRIDTLEDKNKRVGEMNELLKEEIAKKDNIISVLKSQVETMLVAFKLHLTQLPNDYKDDPKNKEFLKQIMTIFKT